MKTVKFIYNETTINFEPTNSEDVMVNATQMAKAFPVKRMNDFLSNQQTQDFIHVCLSISNGNSRYLSFNKREDIIQSRPKFGTYMHRVLALKFAAWLDPEFEFWMITTIDQIILGHYREVREATLDKLKAEKEWKDKRGKALEKYPELAEIFEAELKITKADKKRLKALRAATSQLRFEFESKQKETV